MAPGARVGRRGLTAVRLRQPLQRLDGGEDRRIGPIQGEPDRVSVVGEKHVRGLLLDHNVCRQGTEHDHW